MKPTRRSDSKQRLMIAAVVLVISAAGIQADDGTAFFEREIRPILVKRCESCHSAARSKTRGGLALDSAEGWKKGGEHGPAIVPGDVSASLIIKAISYGDDELQMPPEENGGKLPPGEIARLTEWVRRGAPDPRTLAVARRGGLTENEIRQWWAFQPLAVAAFKSPANSLSNVIDQMIDSRLGSTGLAAAGAADRRTLVRRATYDLTGLPPSENEVAVFLADKSAGAFDKLVERLLASPRYGERWGRHWLDVVRYADTAGENTDHPIADAWRYRNWVIGAFNENMPYDRFVREQLAGDLLHRQDSGEAFARGLVATGFLAISRRFDHDSDKHMHLTHEDAIDTMGKAFLGLSIACARCHDHKYDPISASDYYALYGILESSRFSFPGCEAKQKPRDMVPLQRPEEWSRTVEPWEKAMARTNEELMTIDKELAEAAKGLSAIPAGSLQAISSGSVPEGGGQNLAVEKTRKVKVRRGELLVLTIDPAGNYGADTTAIQWKIRESGSGRSWDLTTDVIGDFLSANPRDCADNEASWVFLDARRDSLALLPDQARSLSGNGSLQAWRKGENPAVFVNTSDKPVKVWTTLAARSLFVHPAQDGPVAIGWASAVEGEVEISGRVADAHNGGTSGVNWRLTHVAADLRPILANLRALAGKRQAVARRRDELLARTPPREQAYAVIDAEKPVDTKMHLRGDPEKPGDAVPRRWLDLFGGERVPAGAGSGRLQLARWLSDPKNPLVSRVIVNRVWQYHFGKGLVGTPNDFGTRGQKPTHPELLDTLAAWFVASGWDLKALHQAIMGSRAYQRSSDLADTAAFARNTEADPTNSMLWRFDRRRLSAEELRDSLLSASGGLDYTPAGPHPLPDPAGWSYTQHVPFAGVPETPQRSVYQMTLRNRRAPFLALFDGADPNATTPLRQVTTVPTQSLYFMNDASFHAQAEALARRVVAEHVTVDKVARLYAILFQREATDGEKDRAEGFIKKYEAMLAGPDVGISQAERSQAAWAAFCRVLMSSNEFLYLD